MARTLAGAWRGSPPPLAASPGELAAIAPLLVQSGSAPLAWWRLRHTPMAASEVGAQLRNAFYWHAVEAHRHERDITAAISALRAAGVEPLLAKGWAVARHYPTAALRPYGDVNLCVAPKQELIAVTALAAHAGQFTPVDLHAKIVDMPDRSFGDLYARSRVERIGDVEVRIFGPEDHLRFLCLHLLRHGARRPLWLCDVAVVLDALPPDFDWDCFLGGERRRTAWAVGVLGLARRLLGAPLDYGPVGELARRAPNWLLPVVLRQWGETFRPQSSREMGAALGRADWFLHGLRERWPNPIEAMYGLDASIDAQIRVRYQLGMYLRRSIGFASGRPYGAEH